MAHGRRRTQSDVISRLAQRTNKIIKSEDLLLWKLRDTLSTNAMMASRSCLGDSDLSGTGTGLVSRCLKHQICTK